MKSTLKCYKIILCCVLLLFLVPSSLQAQGSKKTENSNVQINEEHKVLEKLIKEKPHLKVLNEKALSSKEQISHTLNGRNAKEIIAGRTKYSKQYLLENNKMASVVSLVPIHYEDNSGKLQDIKTVLVDNHELRVKDAEISKMIKTDMNSKYMKVDEDSSSYVAPYLPVGINIAQSFNNGYSVETEKAKISFKPINANDVIGSVHNGSKVLYEEPWEETDVVVEITETGIKETIILKSKLSPTMFSYSIGERLIDELVYEDLKIEPAWLVDANGEYRDVKQQLRVEDGINYLDIIVDTNNLVFPIYVDPSAGYANENIAQYDVRSVFTGGAGSHKYLTYTNSPWIGNEYYYSELGEFPYGYIHEFSGLIKFDLGDLSNVNILSASLYQNGMIYNFHKITELSMITAPWNSNYINITRDLPLNEIVSRWVNGSPNYGIQLFSSHFPETYQLSNLYLFVEYDIKNTFSELRIVDTAYKNIRLEWDTYFDNSLESYLVFLDDVQIGSVTFDVDSPQETYNFDVGELLPGEYTFTVKVKYLSGKIENLTNNALITPAQSSLNKRSYQYNARNQLISIVYRDNVPEEYVYSNNKLSLIKYTGAIKIEFMYDENGNLKTIR